MVGARFKGQNAKPDILYSYNNRVRINWLDMWIALPSADQNKVITTMKDVTAYSYDHLKLTLDQSKREITRQILQDSHCIDFRRP